MPSPPRYTTSGGAIASGTPTAFQTSSAIVVDGWSGRTKNVAIGDDLGDGTLVNDLRMGQFGVEIEVVHPDGKIGVLGKKELTGADFVRSATGPPAWLTEMTVEQIWPDSHIDAVYLDTPMARVATSLPPVR